MFGRTQTARVGPIGVCDKTCLRMYPPWSRLGSHLILHFLSMTFRAEGSSGGRGYPAERRALSSRHMDGPSGRPILTAVETVNIFGHRLDRPSRRPSRWVVCRARGPSERKFYPKKHCHAMLFRSTARPDGQCVAETVLTGRQSYQLTRETSFEIHQSSSTGSRTSSTRRMRALVVCRSTFLSTTSLLLRRQR